MINTTHSLWLKVNSHNPLRAKRAFNKVLESLMSLAALVVVLHVVEVGELSLGDESVSLRPGILISSTDNHREDVRLAILEHTTQSVYHARME